MTIKQQFNEMQYKGILPIIELPVKNKKTGENDYIIFHIGIREGQMQAIHEALNEDEEASDKMAYKAVDINEDFGLNWHLQELLQKCREALNNSTFFELTED